MRIDPIKRICVRCVMDTSDPEITFDESGVCSLCQHAERILLTVQWSDEASERALEEVADRIRRSGAGRDYDSVIGLSGGVDSSFAAHLAHMHGLRPLAVHFDNGWNSELAVENIQRVVEGCGFDLHTYVINWLEFRDLQRAFLRASVVDIELVTDHAIMAATYGLARQHGIKYLLSGNNVATEHGMPESWFWHKLDWTNIKSIHDAFGTVPLRTYPHLSTTRWRLLQLFGMGVTSVQMLNLMNYRRDEAARLLTEKFGWREYGGKHHESLFTKFYQGSILPRKFGIDKRRVHLSDRLRNGEISRAEAQMVLEEPLYDPEEERIEGEYVRKKLGFDEAEWAAIMAAPPRAHSDFRSDREGRLQVALLRRVRDLRARFIKAPKGVL